MTGTPTRRTAGGAAVGCRCADATWDRWSYGEGYTAGLAAGRRDGWVEGYRAGFDSGAEVAGTGLLLGIEHALGERLPNVLAGLPYVAGYLDYRRRTAFTNDPCSVRCGRCSRCIRAAAVAGNLASYGQPDFPGTARPRAGARRPARPRVAA